MLKRLVLGLLVAWAAAGFLQEVNRAVAGWDGRGRQRGPGAVALRHARDRATLARSVEAARRRCPPGASSPSRPGRPSGDPLVALAVGGLSAAGLRRDPGRAIPRPVRCAVRDRLPDRRSDHPRAEPIAPAARLALPGEAADELDGPPGRRRPAGAPRPARQPAGRLARRPGRRRSLPRHALRAGRRGRSCISSSPCWTSPASPGTRSSSSSSASRSTCSPGASCRGARSGRGSLPTSAGGMGSPSSPSPSSC